jgi:hypothetical protein
MSDELAFPADWPENCPPSDAVQGPLTVYRVVKKFPDDAEFKTAHEMDKFRTSCQCQRRGLSVLPSVESARHCKSVMPFRGDVIIRGRLEKHHGKAKHTESRTQPDHWTWWPVEGIDRLEPFAVYKG